MQGLLHRSKVCGRSTASISLWEARSLVFGPFVTVFLGEQDWRQADIGFVLTVGGVAGLLAQYPSGLSEADRSAHPFSEFIHRGEYV